MNLAMLLTSDLLLANSLLSSHSRPLANSKLVCVIEPRPRYSSIQPSMTRLHMNLDQCTNKAEHRRHAHALQKQAQERARQ